MLYASAHIYIRISPIEIILHIIVSIWNIFAVKYIFLTKEEWNKVAISELNHSHKKWKDNLETRTVLIEISMLCWNLPSGPKHRGSLYKKHGFFWRESAICKWFSCSSGWNIGWYDSIYKEMELEMDCRTSRIPLQKASSYKQQFCTKVCVSKGWSLKFKWCLSKI